MDYSRLENNIIDVLKEEQIKLGYRRELVRLYYPLTSLNRFLAGEFDVTGMQEALKGFVSYAKERLGTIGVTNEGERFCLVIPPEGVEYVHEHMDNREFIYDFIKTIERHGCTMEDVLKQFRKHSNHVHVERTAHGEFDYLVYFEDGVPDSFRYCITNEGCHLIYHRFTEEDYNDFDF